MEVFNYFDEAQRPLWFVYSGMGSQWAGMGIDLMCIPMFAAAIERYLERFTFYNNAQSISTLQILVTHA